MMINWMVLLIYLWLLSDFILWPIPSEASTSRLLSMNQNFWFRISVLLVFFMYLLVYLFPLTEAIHRILSPSAFATELRQWTGMAIAITGRIITSTAARQLKRVFPDSLLQTGVFRLSRNPIALGTHLTLLGMVIIFPYWFMVLGWIGGVINLHFKIKLEEKYMMQKFGNDYVDYARSTPRYLIR